MKIFCSLLAATLLGVASLQCYATRHSDGRKASDTASSSSQTATDLRTSDKDLWDLHKLDAQTVMSQGETARPGPRNHHVQPPHGGPVAVGNRSDTPGRE
jgi:hypothetical protein